MTLRHLPLGHAFVVLCLFTAAHHALADESDSLEYRSGDVIVTITNLNPGGCPDTLIGRRTVDDQIVPRLIRWGTCDTSGATILPNTTITVPAWRRLRVSATMQDINADTLTDLIFFHAGRPAGRQAAGDSLRALVLFGQAGLDTHRTIRISDIGRGLRAVPLFTLELEPGAHLIRPLQRDLVGRTSYVLPLVSRDSAADSSSRPLILDVGAMQLTIAPNPVTGLARITSSDVAPGEYRIRIVAVNGRVHHEAVLELVEASRIRDVVDLSQVPPGFYVVTVDSGRERTASYPLVIVR